jgi:hypothetical protein
MPSNVGLAQKNPQLQAHFDGLPLQVRAVLVYSGIHLVSEDRIRFFEDLRRRFSQDQDKETLRQETDNVSEALWASADSLGQYRHFKTIFCSAADCRTLKNATMARLAQVARPTSSPASDI